MIEIFFRDRVEYIKATIDGIERIGSITRSRSGDRVSYGCSEVIGHPGESKGMLYKLLCEAVKKDLAEDDLY